MPARNWVSQISQNLVQHKMTGEASIIGTQEDFEATKDTRQHYAISEVYSLYPSADCGFEPLTWPSGKVIRIEIHDF